MVAQDKTHLVKHRRFTIILILLCVFVLIGGVFLWLLVDARRDPNATFPVKLGSDDPTINGFALLTQYAESDAWQESDQDFNLIAFDDDYNERTRTDEEITQILTTHVEVFDLVNQAMARPEFEIYELFKEDSPKLDSVDAIGLLHQFAKLCQLRAELLKRQGKPDPALRFTMKQGAHFTRFARMEKNLIGLLTAVAANGLLQYQVYTIINKNELAPASVRQALADYPFLGQFDNYWSQSLPMEFATTSKMLVAALEPEFYEKLPFGKPQGGWEAFLARHPRLILKPNKTANQIYILFAEAISQEDKPLLSRRTPQADALGLQKDSWKRWLANNLVGDILVSGLARSTKFISEKVALSQTTDRAHYLLLALRLYELEHGQLPPTLNALAPDYITNVPLDPFDGKPLRYDPAQRIVYSIGEDGVDSGGSSLPSYLDDPEAMDAAEHDPEEPTYFLKTLNENES